MYSVSSLHKDISIFYSIVIML